MSALRTGGGDGEMGAHGATPLRQGRKRAPRIKAPPGIVKAYSIRPRSMIEGPDS
jgi:hypothetical protein